MLTTAKPPQAEVIAELKHIQNAVESIMNIEPGGLKSKSRKRTHVNARAIFYELAFERVKERKGDDLHPVRLLVVANYIGRSHSTIIFARCDFSFLVKTDEQIKNGYKLAQEFFNPKAEILEQVEA